MSLTTAKEMREKRVQLVGQSEEIIKRARDEKRDMNAEELAQFDKIHDEIDSLGEQAQRLERQHDRQKELDERQGTQAGGRQDGEGVESDQDDPGQRMRDWLRNVDGNQPRRMHVPQFFLGGQELRNQIRVIREQRQLMRAGMGEREARALTAGTGSAGGHTIPEDFRNVLETALLQFGGMRQARTTIMRTADGADLPMPSADDTSNKGELLGEVTGAAEQDITFSRTVLEAYKYSSKYIEVSFELLQDTAFDLESWLAERLGERIGRITNEHFTTGDGSGKPNGVISAASVGKVAASATAVTQLELVDLQHTVDPAYRGNAEWMMSDTTLRDIKKLEDQDKRLIWTPGLAVREPDTILGHRYVINQDMANQGTASNVFMAFGDFSKYHIRDVMDIMVMRLDEIEAKKGAVVFIAFSRHDGDLLDAGTGPIKTMRNAAS